MKTPNSRKGGAKLTDLAVFTSSIRLALLLSLFIIAKGEAQDFTLSHKNSSIQFYITNGLNTAGIYDWQVDGVDQLNYHWFYYRVGPAGPEAPLQSISSTPTINTYVNNAAFRVLDLTYANASYSVRLGYSLTGNTVGSGKANFNETITIANTSLAALDFHFFQYSDFDIGGLTGGQSVAYFANDFGSYYKSVQTDGSRFVTETVTPASHIEAATTLQTLVSLTDGNPTTLNDAASAGPGNVTFSYQWDLTLAPGDSFQISKLIAVVPEPSPGLIISCGLPALALVCRRKKHRRS